MEIKKIKQLVEILKAGGLTRLELSEGEDRVVLEMMPGIAPSYLPPPHGQGTPPQFCPTKPVQAEVSENMIPESCSPHDFNNLKEVKSPIVGVFYASPSPGDSPFVSIGSRVKRGDILCIIEAMKLMNEITAECDGEIADVCIANGEIAEYGQVLFKIL